MVMFSCVGSATADAILPELRDPAAGSARTGLPLSFLPFLAWYRCIQSPGWKVEEEEKHDAVEHCLIRKGLTIRTEISSV
jgi:hypothetical protein